MSARAMGCSEPRSSAAAIDKYERGLAADGNDLDQCPCAPTVNVPVLSKMKRSARASASIAWPRVTSTPRAASAPVATVNAAGVANDSAQGQLTTSTATKDPQRARSIDPPPGQRRRHRQQQQGDDEATRNAVGHFHQARPFRRGALHQALDRGHARRLADAFDAHDQGARGIRAAADQRIADAFGHRPALAGQQ
jgi:hypothetical protein